MKLVSIIATFLLTITFVNGQNIKSKSKSSSKEKIATTHNPSNRTPAKVVTSKTNAYNKLGVLKKASKKEVKPIERKLASGKKLPADFPKYVNTGNKEKDAATYRTAKLKWINDNPEKYQAIFRKDQ
ncbi:MAG: hypothetical protein COA97_04535 [Flavobacteriales bacterium]|nr:MAG: hypothetical protein COA97_04535 [Flavobacteriales bacterium]